MSYECSELLRTFITHLLVRMHQKKIALEIAAKIASLKGPFDMLSHALLPTVYVKVKVPLEQVLKESSCSYEELEYIFKCHILPRLGIEKYILH